MTAHFRLATPEEIERAESPEIVVLCGSTRFYEEFRRQNLRLTIEGKIVLSIGCDTKSDGDLFGRDDVDELKARLDALHKQKIDLADRVLVLNVGGYIGESTRSEIEHAVRAGKPIDYLEPVPCSACNGEGVISWMAYDGRETLSPCTDCDGRGYPQ